MEVSIVDKKRLKAFINFPDELYADDDNYVPYMRADIKKTVPNYSLHWFLVPRTFS